MYTDTNPLSRCNANFVLILTCPILMNFDAYAYINALTESFHRKTTRSPSQNLTNELETYWKRIKRQEKALWAHVHVVR